MIERIQGSYLPHPLLMHDKYIVANYFHLLKEKIAFSDTNHVNYDDDGRFQYKLEGKFA